VDRRRLYWVPVDSAGSDPVTSVSVIYDNRRRITTRLSQLRTGKRYAYAPPSTMRHVPAACAAWSARGSAGRPYSGGVKAPTVTERGHTS
jgi:3-phenylpropionate/cinnamic acid dioxygenase small subunit